MRNPAADLLNVARSLGRAARNADNDPAEFIEALADLHRAAVLYADAAEEPRSLREKLKDGDPVNLAELAAEPLFKADDE